MLDNKCKKIIICTLLLSVLLDAPSFEAPIDIQVNPNLPVELQAAQKRLMEQLADHYDKLKNLKLIENMSEGTDIKKVRPKDIGYWVYDPQSDKWYYETYEKGRKAGWINPSGEEWYFCDFFTKEMKIGYHVIDGDVYYFEESKTSIVPQGQLYMNRATNEGYIADENGKLINYTKHISSLQ